MTVPADPHEVAERQRHFRIADVLRTQVLYVVDYLGGDEPPSLEAPLAHAGRAYPAVRRRCSGGHVRLAGCFPRLGMVESPCEVPSQCRSAPSLRRTPVRGFRSAQKTLLCFIIVLFYQSSKAANDSSFKWMWLTIVLSFGFYIPVVLWADVVPMIGMLMIPKTCAYVWTVLIGYNDMKRSLKL